MFAAMILAAASHQRPMKRTRDEGFFESFERGQEANLEGAKRLFELCPGWAKALAAGLVVYAAVNFVVFLKLMHGGSPEEADGQYYLQDHGRVVRQLTKTEYRQFLAYEVRGFSGHLMVFSFFPLVYFTVIEPKRHGNRDRSTASTDGQRFLNDET